MAEHDSTTIPADLAFRLAEIAVGDVSRSFSMLRALAEWTVCLWLCARAADDSLTATARRIIAGLTTWEREDMATAECGDGQWLFNAENASLFDRIGLLAGSGTAVWGSRNLREAEPTDLGREVARLLREEAARG